MSTSCRLHFRNRRVSPSVAGGFALVAVLVVVMLASMVAISLLFRLRADEMAAATSSVSEQAWSAAMSGVQEAVRVARQSTTAGTLDWRDSPRYFRDRLAFEDGSDRWYFTVYSPAAEDELAEVRYGLLDEASRLNLNTSHTADFSKLAAMTPERIQVMRDFIDEDSTPRSEGAEQDAYDTLPQPYRIRNGRLNTVEELLLVRGFTPSILYGEDFNMNHRLDPNENDGEQSAPPDNGDGHLQRGLRSLFTTFSYDRNVDSQGRRRVDINSRSGGFPEGPVAAALTNFVTLLRTNAIKVAHAADLLLAKVKVKDALGREVEVDSGIGGEELPELLDRFSASAADRTEGLINVNTAPVAILATVPGIDEPLAEAIVSARKVLTPERRRTLAWLFQDGVVDAARFKEIAPRLTTRSLQFRFWVVGFGLPSKRFRVAEAVIDLAGPRPALMYLRDLSRLAPPFQFDGVMEKEAAGG